MTEPAPDQIVAEKYRLSRILGRGGMGSVWEGLHTSLGTRVAVKFIDKQYANSEEARTRFENEARAAARLTSKHVVRVYDHGVAEDGSPYIVMEFLEGEPLDQRLERLGRLPPAETATILAQVCRGLTNAHQAGIVHRDLKPENIFLVWDAEDQADVAKVVDFGIAKFEESSGVTSATRTGLVLGTPYYMSPEQARGFKNLDLRSDLWSIGVIAYRCIVGVLPFNGEAMGDLLVKICVDPLPVPSKMAGNVPVAFDDWFVRALSREPEDRFSSAAALAKALLAACGVTQPMGASGVKLSGVSSAVTNPDTSHLTAAPFQERDPRASTGAPFTQTRGRSLRPARLGKSALIAGLIAGVFLTIGILALVTALGKGGTEREASVSQASPAPEQPKASVTAGTLPPSVSTAESQPKVEMTEPTPSSGSKPAAVKSAISKPQVRANATHSAAKPATVPHKPASTKSPEDLLGY